ncbi:MAG: AMP-binding protein [Candidatus Obscuribacterales bacterium]|nr:AMP-binding protein [Candidatus Obscuribacterales bacterium]
MATAKENQGVAGVDLRLSDRLDRIFACYKDSPALLYKEESLTYGELSSLERVFCRRLISAGLKEGDRVALYLPNSPEFVVAFLAVLRAGGVVVPVNPLLKNNEIEHILQDSSASYMVASKSLLDSLENGKALVESLDGVFLVSLESIVKDAKEASSETESLKPVQREAEDLAVLVYTSGTTGNPKGAMLSHGNLESAVEMKRGRFLVDSEDCVLAALPLCHIYGMVVVMLGTLTEGARLSILRNFDASAALAQIARDRVTILPAVPTMFQFMTMKVKEIKEAGHGEFDTSSLKYCVTGGAAMVPEARVEAEETLQAPVLEGYALTEVSCVATLTPLDAVRKPGSAGPAIDKVELKILSTIDRSPLPAGSEHVGEVAIGGPQVMQGYYGNAEATKAAFHQGLFLTGDLGYLDEDGYLFICGRSKELIIRGGQNIYPREIEMVIRSLDSVEDVAVVGIPDRYMGERVKAVVVLKTESGSRSRSSRSIELSESELEEFCRARLAPYKVPRIFEFRDSLPRNSTGKVLKRLLV